MNSPKSFKGMLVALACCAWLWPAAMHAQQEDPGAALARAELAKAEEAVAAAWARQALWTTARDALRDAREALAAGDHAAAIRSARWAAEQAQLGIDQLAYPRFPE